MRDRDYDDLPRFVIETRGGGDAGTFLLGALLGAAAALLLAPRSGAETQAEILGAARRLRDGVEGRVEEVRGGITGRVDRARGGVQSRVDTVRGAVETRLDRARAAVSAGRRAAGDARSELQRRVDDAKRTYRDGLTATRSRRADADGGDVGPVREAEVVIVEAAVEEERGDLA